MNRIARILGVLAVLGGTLMAFLATGPAALAYVMPPFQDGTDVPPARIVTTGGMAGWQITLIALGAALLASTTAVIADRSRAARRRASAASA